MSASSRAGTGWNFGDLLDGVEAVLPQGAPALLHGDRRIDWGDFGRLSNHLAAALLARGGRPGDKVALYMRNRPEYLLALAACFKARLVHVNVNYRYVEDELRYILDNSDAKFVVFGEEFSELVDRLRDRLPSVSHWLQAGGRAAPFAEGLDRLMQEGRGAPLGTPRSPEDLLFVYTGGTTGMPKGVMWPQASLWQALGGGGTILANAGVIPDSPNTHVANVKVFGPGARQLVACPYMHGTGLFTAILNLVGGGCSITLEGEKFDPIELFDAVERHAVQALVIVGDAFAKPMLNALDANPGRWKLDSLKIAISSGVMWSREVKLGLLRHHGGMVLADMLSSSEAVGFGVSATTAVSQSTTAVFRVGEHCKVFTEDHREVAPGSGEQGFIARSGAIPLGYYKDPKKTAETFPTIAGVRYSAPGDWCTVEADGTLTLLGRGSVCINTAGEKVHPEEVEEALKTHPDVEDALVVGVPDEKWGQAVTAVVQLRPGAALDEAALRGHVGARLARYKVPKRLLSVREMFRAPNGKADYRGALAFAREELGLR